MFPLSLVQRWVTTGAPELAIEALVSQETPFKANAFVCWALGALRFIPLAVPSVGESYVQHKQLLSVAFDRMELHPHDPLVLENGFAVLANYQRKQPSNSRLFSKLRPNVRDTWDNRRTLEVSLCFSVQTIHICITFSWI